MTNTAIVFVTMSGSGWVRFRTDAALDDALDQAVDYLEDELEDSGIKASRSTVARYLLDRALQQPIQKTVLRESIKRIHAIIQRAANRAVADVIDRLPQYIDEELE